MIARVSSWIMVMCIFSATIFIACGYCFLSERGKWVDGNIVDAVIVENVAEDVSEMHGAPGRHRYYRPKYSYVVGGKVYFGSSRFRSTHLFYRVGDRVAVISSRLDPAESVMFSVWQIYIKSFLLAVLGSVFGGFSAYFFKQKVVDIAI